MCKMNSGVVGERENGGEKRTNREKKADMGLGHKDQNKTAMMPMPVVLSLSSDFVQWSLSAGCKAAGQENENRELKRKVDLY